MTTKGIMKKRSAFIRQWDKHESGVINFPLRRTNKRATHSLLQNKRELTGLHSYLVKFSSTSST